MIIRAEKQKDYDQIHSVNYQAFKNEFEPQLVAALRNSPGFIPELSLVAVENNKVIGHILFTKIWIKTQELQELTVLSLAPLAVLPEYQRQGVGSALMRTGLAECLRLGYSIVVVFGHPEYYPRFGFIPARSKGLEVPFAAPDAAFMVAELVPDALHGITGMVIHPPEFGV